MLAPSKLQYIAHKPHPNTNTQPPERARGHSGSMAQKAGILKQRDFFSAIAESGKPLLKELWHAASKQQEAVLNFVFLCLELSSLWFLSGF